MARLTTLVVATAACSIAPGRSPAATVEPSTVATLPALLEGCPTAQPPALAPGETRIVTIKTDLGEILIHIEGNLSPIAAANFVALAECGWYDGVVFHRVVEAFVIQGGDGQYGRSPNVDPTLVGTGGPGYTISDEPVMAIYGRGIVAMARTPAPNSVGSQFFIVLDDEARTALEQANTYQIIGKVANGIDTVEAIAAAADRELPTEPVVMTDVSVAGN